MASGKSRISGAAAQRERRLDQICMQRVSRCDLRIDGRNTRSYRRRSRFIRAAWQLRVEERAEGEAVARSSAEDKLSAPLVKAVQSRCVLDIS